MPRECSEPRKCLIHGDILHRVCPIPLDYLSGYAYECEIECDGFDSNLFTTHGIDCPESIQNAVSTRQAEFFAGRLAAQKALQHLGFVNYSIALREDRTPGWPPGVVGSISHKKHYAVACVRSSCRDGDGLGIDIEDTLSEKTAERLADYILNEDEKLCLEHGYSCDPAHCITVAFSAKESLFKALYPSVRSYFDFLDVHIVGVSSHTLTLRLMHALSSQRAKGDLFMVQIYPYRGGILTYVDLEHPSLPS